MYGIVMESFHKHIIPSQKYIGLNTNKHRGQKKNSSSN